MNRLVIIGNGFDLAHGLKTSYMDFINWYWDQRVDGFVGNTTKVSEDCLCKLTMYDNCDYNCWNVYAFNHSYFKDVHGNRTTPGSEVINAIRKDTANYAFALPYFFNTILQSIETKRWVDIENIYYQLLKRGIDNPLTGYTIEELNNQLAYLQSKLIEYLTEVNKGITAAIKREDIKQYLSDHIQLNDIETTSLDKVIAYDLNHPEKDEWNPKRTLLLNFNYTKTADLYCGSNYNWNHIHGEVWRPEEVIFGYGDELDKGYQDILEKNDNELLRNIKSVKYLETSHYRKMLDFLRSAEFQVIIMGHSCGNSDRTLLNTIFEHENCISIKPYYHIWEDGTDNYLDIVQNIYRNFTNMKLFRDRVVNKEQCQTM